MRLSPSQIDILKRTAQEILGSGVNLYLFGSRLDDSRRGGDIDLYVVGFSGTVEQQQLAKIRFLAQVKTELGDQRIDLVFAPTADQERLPIHQMAEQTGIAL